MTRYLTVPEVLAINAEVVRKFGGTHAVRNGGLLDSAVARPESGYYTGVFEEAAALFESLSQNHPFVDGNKRTAITATGVKRACGERRRVAGPFTDVAPRICVSPFFLLAARTLVW